MGCTWGHKGDVLMGSQVIRKFGSPYQMGVMSGQRSRCSLHTKCVTWNSVCFDLGDLYIYLFHRIESFLCSP